MYFSHCYNNKTYLFYSRSKTSFLRTDYRKTLENVYLNVFLLNQRLSAKNVKLDYGILKKRFKNFEQIFYYEKRKKTTIRTDCIELIDHMLVFDLKNDILYFDKNSFLSS